MGNIQLGRNEERDVITIGARNCVLLTYASTTETETGAKVAACYLVTPQRVRACLDALYPENCSEN